MRVNNATAIGAIIRAVRTDKGWTQASLSQQVGVSSRWLREVEQGKDTASLGLVLRTLAVLEISVTLDWGGVSPAGDEPLADYPDIDKIVALRLKR
jgi:y4mF family transcriptional regulator